MGKVKLFLGISLMILSAAGLLFWEMKGRDVVLLESVLVAREDIPENTKLDPSHFAVKGIPRENLLDGVLREKDLKALTGRISAREIEKNSQLTLKAIEEKNSLLLREESIFVIEPHWISMRSSSLRRDDWIEIYRGDGSERIGMYRVAFVKDNADREVRDIGLTGETKKEKNWLDRTDSTAVIDHIEIISTLEDYMEILQAVGGEEGGSLLILQKGERSAS